MKETGLQQAKETWRGPTARIMMRIREATVNNGCPKRQTKIGKFGEMEPSKEIHHGCGLRWRLVCQEEKGK